MPNQELRIVSQEQSLLTDKTLCLVMCSILFLCRRWCWKPYITTVMYGFQHDYSLATLRFAVQTFPVALRDENELRNFKSRIIRV